MDIRSYEKQRKRSMTVNEDKPSEQTSRGNKTPHIPGLDFGKLNTKKIEIGRSKDKSKQRSDKKEDQGD